MMNNDDYQSIQIDNLDLIMEFIPTRHRQRNAVYIAAGTTTAVGMIGVIAGPMASFLATIVAVPVSVYYMIKVLNTSSRPLR